jgi:hypothetical protein
MGETPNSSAILRKLQPSLCSRRALSRSTPLRCQLPDLDGFSNDALLVQAHCSIRPATTRYLFCSPISVTSSTVSLLGRGPYIRPGFGGGILFVACARPYFSWRAPRLLWWPTGSQHCLSPNSDIGWD